MCTLTDFKALIDDVFHSDFQCEIEGNAFRGYGRQLIIQAMWPEGTDVKDIDITYERPGFQWDVIVLHLGDVYFGDSFLQAYQLFLLEHIDALMAGEFKTLNTSHFSKDETHE